MSSENSRPGISRRNLFKIGGGVVAATILGSGTYAYLHRGASVQLERLGITLPKALNPLPAPPADAAQDDPREPDFSGIEAAVELHLQKRIRL